MEDPDLDTLNPDNTIPEETAAAIAAALILFEKSRKETILKGASRAYLRGEQVAHKRLLEPFVPGNVKDDVYSFLKTYKGQLDEGYTVIQGEKTFWLEKRTLQEREKIFQIVSDGIVQGKSPAVVRKEFQDYFSMQKYEADRIARTETAYVQARGRDNRYIKHGVEKVKWLCGAGACELCAPLEGHVFTWDELPYEQPVHPQCFLPGTRYKAPGGIVTGLRAWYDGQAVELTISEGCKLAVTSNHMFLTPFGFARANQLCEGDNIIYCPGFEGIVSDDPDNNEMPARVEDIFDALLKSGSVLPVSVPVSPEDLHGDGESVKGDIDVIRPDRLLGRAGETGVTEPGYTPLLNTGAFPGSFDADSPLTEMLKSLAFAADGGMSRSRAPAPFFGRKLPHVDIHRFRGPAGGYTDLNKSFINGAAVNVEPLRKCINGGSSVIEADHQGNVDFLLPTSHNDPDRIETAADGGFPDVKTLCELLYLNPGVIELREIIGIKIIPYHGYVYDFETLSTLCIGNGVITSNCRCDLAPIL